jgi:peptidoglycan/LPS O-acetylase OafA/YrhL
LYYEKPVLIMQIVTATSPVKRFAALDSWRGICAMMVVLYHVPKFFFFSDLSVIDSGWLFVDFFFVLSGFVTTHTYGTERANLDSALHFIRRRFFRIYPLHFCTFAVFLGWILIFDTARLIGSMRFPEVLHATHLFANISFEKIISHLTLVQGFVGNSGDVGFNIPSWAVSVEFWTYIVFSICCLLLGGHLLLGQLFLTVACLLLLFALSGREVEWYGNMLRCLAGFSLGSTAYLLLTKLKNYPLNLLIMTALEGIVVVEILGFLWLASQRSRTDHTIFHLQWLSPIVFAQVIAVFSFEGGTLSRVLNRRFLSRAGTYSYSIYMVHAFILNIILAFLAGFMRLSGLDLAISKATGTAILVFFMGILWYIARWTYNRIERPGQTVLPHLLARFVRPRTKSLDPT